MRFNEIPEATLWLEQFSECGGDRTLAGRLLERIQFVSPTRLTADIEDLLLSAFKGRGPTALFVERELPKTRSPVPPAMYKEQLVRRPGRRRFVRRAFGADAPLVKSMTNLQQSVGSEGPLAQALSQFCASHKRAFVLQPAAELVRTMHVRQLVIVTDFLGSGDRVRRMLDSLWRVASVKSWRSGQFIELAVVAFTGTETGIAAVREHQPSPAVHVVMDCPTISTSFSNAEATQIEDLCQRYAPLSERPLGYGDVGALVAFAHSCPNNAPAILIESSDTQRRPWRALFPRRRTLDFYTHTHHSDAPDFELLLGYLGYPTVAGSPAFLRSRRDRKTVYLLLAALSKRQRTIPELIRATALTLYDLRAAIDAGTALGLVRNLRLLPAGRRELDRQVRSKSRKQAVEQTPRMYYPNALRAPK